MGKTGVNTYLSTGIKRSVFFSTAQLCFDLREAVNVEKSVIIITFFNGHCQLSNSSRNAKKFNFIIITLFFHFDGFNNRRQINFQTGSYMINGRS